MNKIKILAIDDNIDNLTVFQNLISKLLPEAEVFTALSGRKGIGLIVKEDPDVIFLDIMMPMMDGFDVCSELKKDERLKIIPVVFYTAHLVTSKLRIKALEAGSEALLTKPFDEIELVTLIRILVKIKMANLFTLNQKELLAKQVSEQTVELEQELARRKNAEALQAGVQLKLRKGQIALLNIMEDLKTENKARKQGEEKYRLLFTQMNEGFALHEIILNKKGKPIDYRYLEVNQSFEVLTGLKAVEVVGKTQMEIFPEFNKHRLTTFGKVALTGKSIQFSQFAREFQKTYDISVFSPKKGQFATVFKDVTEQLRTESELRDSHKELSDLTRHLEEVREEERTAIALNLHDDLGQKLTAINIDLAWLARRIPPEAPNLSEKVISMQLLLMDAINRVKKISSELRPSILDDLGIGAAIEWQANEFSEHSGITCKISIIPEEMMIPPKQAIHVFRIVQESLTNVMRHAEAKRVLINLIQKENKWRVRVKDNGKGISSEKIKDAKSFGLLGMRERANLCGGKLTIRGEEGKGTEIVVEIPFG